MNIIECLNNLIEALKAKQSKLKPKEFYNIDEVYDFDDIEDSEKYMVYLFEHKELLSNEIKRFTAEVEKDMIECGIGLARADISVRDVALKVIVDLANIDIEAYNKAIVEVKSNYRKIIKKLGQVVTIMKSSRIDMDEINSIFDELISLIGEDDPLLKASIHGIVKGIEEYKEVKDAEEAERKRLLELSRQEEHKQEEIIEEPKKLIVMNNYELVEPVLLDNMDIIDSFIGCLELKDTFTFDEIVTFISWPFYSFEITDLKLIISSILFKINNESNTNTINGLVNCLSNILTKIDLCNTYSELVEKSKSICNTKGLTEDDINIIQSVQSSLNNIFELNSNDEGFYTLFDEYDNSLNNIIRKQYDSNATDNEKISIKGFVLFDYKKDESENLKPYILNDLNQNDKNNYIEESIPKDKLISNGFEDFNDIIDDIIIMGDPGAFYHLDDKISRLLRPVYNSSGSHSNFKSTASNSTGLFRIRPRLRSHLRFIDEKIYVQKGTKKYDQIKELLESKLDNLSIEGDFNIYINYLSAIKEYDTEPYLTCIKRRSQSVLGDLLSKDELSQEDILELDKAIDATIDAYKELQGINDSFKFKTIDKMSSSGISRK